jgi:Ras GTPase-activating-like protein IQGAP2/3
MHCLTVAVINVQPAEDHFDIDEFNDLYTKTKPTLYMKVTDIIAIHQYVAQDIAVICPNRDDVLREVLQELGSAKNNEADMLSGTSTEITLMLNPKFQDVEGTFADHAMGSLMLQIRTLR